MEVGGEFLTRSVPLQDDEVGACRPAASPPEPLSRLIVSIKENVAFENAQGSERRQARFDHLPSHTTSTILRQDSQMMQIATPSVVAAKHRAYQLYAVSGNQAKARISIQKGSKLAGIVRFIQPNPFRCAPKTKHGFELAICHARECDIHIIWRRRWGFGKLAGYESQEYRDTKNYRRVRRRTRDE
jgi:hypothetical protein